MSDKRPDTSQYSYHAMSNKVEQQDSAARRRGAARGRSGGGGGEPTGEVESLRGRADLPRMGDRVVTKPPKSASSSAGAATSAQDATAKQQRKAHKRRAGGGGLDMAAAAAAGVESAGGGGGGKKSRLSSSVHQEATSILDLNLTAYQPSTDEAKAAYKSLLTILGSKSLLGNQAPAVLRDAAEEVLVILKNDNLRDVDRHEQVSLLLTGKSAAVAKNNNNSAGGGMATDQFASLLRLAKEMNDYHDNSNKDNNQGDGNAPGEGGGGEEQVDDEMGVAVVFDDSDDEQNKNNLDGGGGDSDVDADVVVDASSSSSEDEDDNKVDDDAEQQANLDIVEDSEEKVVQGNSRDAAHNKKNTTSSTSDDKDNVDYETDPKSKARRRRHRGLDSSGGDAGPRILSVHEIDAHFLQRQLSRHYPDDANLAAERAAQVLEILDVSSKTNTGDQQGYDNDASNSDDLRVVENRLIVLLGLDDLIAGTIQLLLKNRIKVWACVTLKRAQTEAQRVEVQQVLQESGHLGAAGQAVWDEIASQDVATREGTSLKERIQGLADSFQHKKTTTMMTSGDNALDSIDSGSIKAEADDGDAMDVGGQAARDREEEMNKEPVMLDLEALTNTVSNKTCQLPESSFRAMKKGYEEVHVPAVRAVIDKKERLIDIAELPKWTHRAFAGMNRLNRVQSRMCNVALESSENLLLCAPTGAGKTNVACLAMLNILGQYRLKNNDEANNDGDDDDDDKDKPEFDLSAFKIVYVSPMKALVQEQVKNFSQRLKDYNVTVRELSGDSSLSRQQIAETQLLVTTPEKFDIVTRQGEGRAFTQLIKLVIIDEIHLLHDERGSVLESIVARIIRQVETTAEPIRLVGLSATLPNYADVATFLRVNPDKGLFFFDHSYRPVPLQMQYIGITERNAFRRFQLQNEICYEKALAQRRQGGNQMLIFVHSRAETGKTAKALRDIALDRDEIPAFCRDGGATQEILRDEAATVKNADLKDVLPYGFAIHHAGMARDDRELVEDLFADRHIAVLCTTATLAWGVNLPAHAVIIKGTQIYDPSKGKWAELSPLDILQMLGRAGRPQYDSEGEGIILTQHSQLQYYLSLTNLQMPVESQLIPKIPDALNAEVSLGTIQTTVEAVDWLSYTFLYVRMLQNPNAYGISDEALKEDPLLKKRRLDLVHTAATVLERSHLVRYDRKSTSLQPTPFGRVASQFYISHSSMAVYNRHMRPNMSEIELLRLFALSGEFTHITVREEEKLELTKLAGRVPIPVKENPNEPSAKVNILLQAYISRLKLDGFALVADMAFIQQSAARLMRALFEIALRRKWASLAKLCLDLSNMVSYRVWRSQSPLRQFKNVPEVVARKLERKSDIEWARYTDLTASDLGELVGVPKMGRVLQKLVEQFPRLEISAQVQPITRSMLRVELSLIPAFHFDVSVHGYVQLFHVLVEDVNGEMILHHEMFSLKSRGSEEDQVLVFSVPILDPLPPAYFVRVISDRWLHSVACLPISFNTLILPSKFSPPTELLDLQPLLPSVLAEPALVKIFSVKEFNAIQTQTFHEIFKTDRNCLVCAPSNSGKTICAAFAILRMLSNKANGKCVYVAPTDDIADPVYDEWLGMFGSILPKGSVARLIGEAVADLKVLAGAKIVVASVKQWDMLSRRWRQRKAVQAVSLIIFDELHMLGGSVGPTMEVVISRTRYMSDQLQESKDEPGIRIVGLGSSIANARDVGEWMGVPNKSLFNFSPKARPCPLEIYFQSFEQSNYSGRLLAMAKPVFNAVDRHFDGKSAIVFVPSRRQAQLTAIDLMTYRENSPGGSFLGKETCKEEITRVAAELREPALQQVVSAGVGFVHGGMVDNDWKTVLKLYREGTIRVLVCPAELCWKLQCVGHLVVIMGTEAYDGSEGRHVDYPISDLLHMMGRHEHGKLAKCVILCHAPKKEYLKKLLYEPLPIESHLDSYLHDPLNSEIVTKTVASMQDAVDYLTWSFLYRRLPKNPTYYGLRGTSSVHLSEHLSEMIETVVGDLEESKCCKVSDEGDLSALNLGMIAAYYYVQYRSIELIAASVNAKTKIRGVLEILSAAWEFSSLPVRYGEEKGLRTLARTVVHQPPEGSSYTANTKALILLQCHFSRKPLPVDMRADQRAVLKEAVNLVQAIVDVISSNGWLKPALAAMELSQMVVQGLWNRDHVLKQIPHFSDEIIKRCVEHKGDEPVESVFDILSLDDGVRNDLLQLPEDKMADVAVFCNNYPNIEISFKVQDPDDVTSGDPVQILITLQRDVDEEEMDEEEIAELGKVSAPLFPAEKKEAWWVAVGDTSTNSLLSLKRVTLKQKTEVKLEFLAPEEAGDYDLTLFCMSDSYLGCDQEYSVPLSVAAADSDNSEDEE